MKIGVKVPYEKKSQIFNLSALNLRSSPELTNFGNYLIGKWAVLKVKSPLRSFLSLSKKHKFLNL